MLDGADKRWIQTPLPSEMTWSQRVMFKVWQLCRFKEVM